MIPSPFEPFAKSRKIRNDPPLVVAHIASTLDVAEDAVPMCTPTSVGDKFTGAQTSKAEVGVVVPMPSLPPTLASLEHATPPFAIIRPAEVTPPVAVIRPVEVRVPPTDAVPTTVRLALAFMRPADVIVPDAPVAVIAPADETPPVAEIVPVEVRVPPMIVSRNVSSSNNMQTGAWGGGSDA